VLLRRSHVTELRGDAGGRPLGSLVEAPVRFRHSAGRNAFTHARPRSPPAPVLRLPLLGDEAASVGDGEAELERSVRWLDAHRHDLAVLLHAPRLLCGRCSGRWLWSDRCRRSSEVVQFLRERDLSFVTPAVALQFARQVGAEVYTRAAAEPLCLLRAAVPVLGAALAEPSADDEAVLGTLKRLAHEWQDAPSVAGPAPVTPLRPLSALHRAPLLSPFRRAPVPRAAPTPAAAAARGTGDGSGVGTPEGPRAPAVQPRRAPQTEKKRPRTSGF
jgi:hypothetical protein